MCWRGRWGEQAHQDGCGPPPLVQDRALAGSARPITSYFRSIRRGNVTSCLPSGPKLGAIERALIGARLWLRHGSHGVGRAVRRGHVGHGESGSCRLSSRRLWARHRGRAIAMFSDGWHSRAREARRYGAVLALGERRVVCECCASSTSACGRNGVGPCVIRGPR